LTDSFSLEKIDTETVNNCVRLAVDKNQLPGVSLKEPILIISRKLGLNKRQIKTIMYVKEKMKITNKEYQRMASVSKPTATRDLGDLATLVDMGLLKQIGTTGKGTFYELKKAHQCYFLSLFNEHLWPFLFELATEHFLFHHKV